MKKVIALVFMAAILLSFSSFSSAAGAGVISVTDAEATPGKNVSVNVIIESNPGVMFISIKPLFDDSALELISMEPGFSGWTVGTSANWDGIQNESFTGMVLTLNFLVNRQVKAGDYPIDLEVWAANFDEKKVPFSVTAGTVSVVRVPGDMNGDNEVNAEDLSELAQYIITRGLSNTAIHNFGDLNDDKTINGADLVMLCQYVYGIA